MKERINSFKGIYLDRNETALPLGYCRSFNGLIDFQGLQAKRPGKGSVVFDSSSKILFFDEIMLDADKYGVKKEGNNYTTNYVYNPRYYWAVITEDSKLKLYKETLVKEYQLSGSFKKAINHGGILYVATSTGISQLMFINRTTNRRIPKTSDEYYKEVSTEFPILKKTTYQQGNQTDWTNLGEDLGISVEIKKVDSEVVVTQAGAIVYGDHWQADFFVGDRKFSRHVIRMDLIDDDNLLPFGSVYFMASGPGSMTDVYYGVFPIYEVGHDSTARPYYSLILSRLENWGGMEFWQSRGLDIIDHTTWTYNQIIQLSSNSINVALPFQIDETNGFFKTILKPEALFTYLLDDGTEIALEKTIISDIASAEDYFIYQIAVQFPTTLTTRVTAFRMYLKHSKNGDFELALHHSFYDNNPMPQIITALDLSGISSTQTMGALDPTEKKNVVLFEDIILINGMMLGIANSSVLYPVIGNGQLSKLYYQDQAIPGISGDFAIDINGYLGISDRKQVYLVNIDSQEGVFIFALKDKMGFIVKDKNDKVETPDGVFLHTDKGIYLTDGQSLQLVSEAINQIVKDGFYHSNIFYDVKNKRLWYVNSLIEKIYIYSFEYQVWTETDYSPFLNFSVSRQGASYIADDRKIYLYQESPAECVYESLKTNLSSTGFLETTTQIDFEFKGSIKWNDTYIGSKERATETIYVKAKKRYPEDYQEWKIVLGAGSTLYGMEINFEVFPKKNEYIKA